ncbi:hypothetical protein HUZ36_16515 [Pseudoalteromonas sp. McH1-7]|uniref:Uncharacterized protein n=2 Tax=Pseudoalteromonas TaxID=53246 RepID=A0A8I0N0K1_9GAMM|nr:MULTISPECIES: hypothetical protein [Pseudoalteromonas]MBE0348520.1 hypothetical protein [Pseudoalteromonas peptidolytica F12-50-A1]MDW7551408.1 hypothetical protein [Pseudoalteromonas peptidolytica]NLR17025.1 hypothetical protein [Pseudoalteromonas peptidolytica]NUZ12388.1 hypothetical protein [Pseudoalteromonas sp. McH1-7]USD30826.1 hypothetical protein J8Z24_17795 [Pseudoalteromonas sp. SCSIO 43201]
MYIQNSAYSPVYSSRKQIGDASNNTIEGQGFANPVAKSSETNSFMAAAKAVQEKTSNNPQSIYLVKHFEQAEKIAHESLVSSSHKVGSREYNIEMYREMMTNIVEMPIEVEIAPEEMNQALLFNHLGLDFKEYKTISVRSELFSMLEQKVDQDSTLLKSDKAKLTAIIADMQDRLEAAQAALLEGEDVAERLQDSKKAIYDSYEQLKLGKVSQRDLLAAL